MLAHGAKYRTCLSNKISYVMLNKENEVIIIYCPCKSAELLILQMATNVCSFHYSRSATTSS